MLDLLIRGGTVVDGTGGEPIVTDVGVRGDRIDFIGDARRAGLSAARTIDAAGLVVAPGFIDPHTHALEDLGSPERHANLAFLMQGVTTVVTGNDGAGPIAVGRVFDRWRTQGIGTNAALLVGHGTVRAEVMKMAARAPDRAELERMKGLMGEAMDGGALGMSTGLYYAPGNFATTDEVIALARVVADRGGVYDSHMRDESSYSIGLLGSIEETIRIGREARIPVHISHIKALGTDVWGRSVEAVRLIQRARAEGVQVTADQYPYTASGTSVGNALLPRWALADGRDALLKRIADPAVRQKLVAEMEANLVRRGGADSLLIIGGRDQRLVGRRLDAIARDSKTTPIDAALDIVRNGDAAVASFNMEEADIERFMRQDWVSTGSDGSDGHPRKYGTFPRKIREYVLNRRVISMAFAVRASSALTAETYRIADRGRLTPGYFADVIVFDPQTIADRSTYEQPELTATGMRYIVVNGKLAVDDGRPTGVLAGRPIAKR